MADIKISELTAITGANTAADDELVIVDTSADETKKISRAELSTALGAGAVDSVNGQTGTVVLDADDISDTSTTNKYTTAADISKLAGIAAGAEVNAVDSVNTQTGAVVLDADDISDTSTTNKYTTAGDISKLAGIESLADVTDATNVAAAGAAMLTGATFTGDVNVNGTITVDTANPEFMRITGTTDTGYAQFSFGSASSPSTTGTHMVNTASGLFQIKTGNPSQGSAQKQLEIDTDGNMDVTGELIAASYNETYDALSGTTPTVDCHNGNMFSLTTSGNTTFTFSNPPASGTAFGFTLKLVAGGTHTITYPASVDWAGGTAPDAPASGETDVLVFITHDGGTTWYGFRAGDAMA